MIIPYTKDENIFVVTVYRLLVTAEKIKSQANICFKINYKEKTKMPRKGEYVRLQNYEKTINAYSESALVPEDDRKQNRANNELAVDKNND